MSPRTVMMGSIAFLFILLIVFAMMIRGSSEDEPPSDIKNVSITAKKI